MNLDRAGCFVASKDSLKNAKAKFSEAELLAGNKSYGTASTLMITSMEEAIKSMILALDSSGFKFRTNVRGIKSLFKQHGLRYQFAFVLSVVHIFVRDIQFIQRKIERKEDLSLGEFDVDRLIRLLRIKLHLIKQEIDWFENIGFHREKGLYYDVKSGVVNPENFKKPEYEMVAQRVKGIISIIDFIHVISTDENNANQFTKLREQFMDDKWYSFMSDLVEKVNKNKGPVLSEAKEFLSNFEEILNDEETIELMKLNYEKLKDRNFGLDGKTE